MAPRMTLWPSKSVAPWEATWESYEEVVAALEKDKLVELDDWFRTELPTTLHARDPAPFITQPELVKLMEWKLKKGKWRPQLMKFVTNLSDKDVKAASTLALKHLKDGHIKAAVEALSALKGIGPATASAVLAAYDEQIPFMGDEALEAIASIIGPRKYTLSHYLSFHEELKNKAQWLRKESENGASKDKSEAALWTPQRVQLCLYAEANAKSNTTTGTPAPAKAVTKTAAKRKTRDETAESTESTEQAEGATTLGTRRSTRQKKERS